MYIESGELSLDDDDEEEEDNSAIDMGVLAGFCCGIDSLSCCRA